jgi:hypothetical protein
MLRMASLNRSNLRGRGHRLLLRRSMFRDNSKIATGSSGIAMGLRRTVRSGRFA